MEARSSRAEDRGAGARQASLEPDELAFLRDVFARCCADRLLTRDQREDVAFAIFDSYVRGVRDGTALQAKGAHASRACVWWG